MMPKNAILNFPEKVIPQKLGIYQANKKKTTYQAKKSFYKNDGLLIL
jgi:hypothetical protein